jgi:phosphohistidine phosphatase SixA
MCLPNHSCAPRCTPRRIPPGLWSSALALALLLLPLPGLEAQSSDAGPELIVLVRHAEKAEAPPADPPLSPVGLRRAEAMAALLGDAGITRIFVSETLRARQTAEPLARALGIELEVYDPRELGGFAGELRALPGRVLVVGHSNTTDELSGALGGERFGPIVESWEYDRLYLLWRGGPTLLLRMGTPEGTPEEGAL